MHTNDEIISLLEELMQQSGLSLSELARRVGMSKSSISRYLNKERQFPLERAGDFGKVFNVSAEKILGITPQKIATARPLPINDVRFERLTDIYRQLNSKRQENVQEYAENQLREQKIVSLNDIKKTQEMYTKIPDETETVLLYGEVSAGAGLELFEEAIDEVQCLKPVPRHDIALRVKGNSMDPVFEDGEVVFVKKTPYVAPGKVGIFVVNGKAYIKKLYRNGGDVRLVSINKEYSDITLTENDDAEIIGQVIM